MINSIIKVSGTIAANVTSDDIASIDIPEDALIMCIGGVIVGNYVPAPAAAQNTTVQLTAELSFLSTNQIGVNDARGTIAGIGLANSFFAMEAVETGAGGAKLSEQNALCIADGIAVNAGERIHLHGISNALNLTGTATFLLYMKTSGGARRSIRRR